MNAFATQPFFLSEIPLTLKKVTAIQSATRAQITQITNNPDASE